MNDKTKLQKKTTYRVNILWLLLLHEWLPIRSLDSQIKWWIETHCLLLKIDHLAISTPPGQTTQNVNVQTTIKWILIWQSNSYLFKITALKLPRSVFWFSAWLTIISIVSSLVPPFWPTDFDEIWRVLTKSFKSGAAERFNASRRSLRWLSSSKKPIRKKGDGNSLHVSFELIILFQLMGLKRAYWNLYSVMLQSG